MAPLRAMGVLAALAASEDGLSLTQLSERLALPKSSLFGLLKSLEKGGYISSASGHHRLDRESYNLASVILRRRPVPERLHPELKRLSEACGETVTLSMPREAWTKLMYVDVIEANTAFRFVAKVGASRPLYCTTPGIALLAYAPDAARAHYLRTCDFQALTPDTLTSARALQAAMTQLRKEGVWVANSGTIEGAGGVSAPVFDEHGDIAAAVALTTLSLKVDRHHALYKTAVLRTAKAMSRILGYSGDFPPRREK